MRATRHECGCVHHRPPGAKGAGSAGSRWANLGPILACAVCPAHLAAYAKLLACFGLGLSMTESTHHFVLAGAVAVALAASGWQAFGARRWEPLGIALVGGTLIGLAQAFDEQPLLVWSGAAVLLFGGPLLQRLRRARPSPVDAIALAAAREVDS